MARISTYDKDVSLSGKDKVVGSNYVSTINTVDQYTTTNFTLKDLAEYFAGQIIIDPSLLSLKTNGGLAYETVNDTNLLAVNLSHTNITGQLANSDLVNSSITINGTAVALGGSINVPIGDITEVTAGTYLNGGGTTGDITLNHDNTSRSDTTSTAAPAYGATFTAIDSITTNATGHITAANLKTITIPASDDTNTTYTVEAIDDGDNAKIRLVGANPSSTDDIKLKAGSNITINVNETTDEIEIVGTAFGNTFTVANETAHLVLTTSSGDLVIRTDQSKTYIDNGTNASPNVMSNYTELQFSGIQQIDLVAGDGIDLEDHANNAITTLTQNNNDLKVINTLATASERGGIKIGYTESGKNYPVELDSEKAYVNVPWVNTNQLTEWVLTDDDDDNTTIDHGKHVKFVMATGVLGTNTTGAGTDADPYLVTLTSPDSNTTYTAGAGLDLTGTEFSHTDTSSQASVNNSGRTYIQDITLDTYGHVTGLVSATETVVDTNTNQLTTWDLLDDDNDSFTISHDKHVKFTSGTGAYGTNITGAGTSSDPYIVAITSPNDTDPNTFRIIKVDTNNDGTANETIGATEELKLIGGTNVTLAENAGTVTITSTDTNTTNWNFKVDSGTAENIAASETVTFTGGDRITLTQNGKAIDISADSQTDNNFTDTLKTKLDNIEDNATADQTAAEIRTKVGTGNEGVIPAAGSAGEFLKHDGTFGTPSYTTNTDTQLTTEQVQDIVGNSNFISGSGATTVTYDDNANTLVISSTDTNTDTNTFRTIEVDTDGNDSANETLSATETLRFKKGTNITLAESEGVLTISSTDTNTQNTAAEIRTKVGTGNSGVIPAVGNAGEFLKHDGTFGTPSYTTNTDTQLTTAQVRAKFSAGTNVTITNGEISSTDTNTQRTDEEIRDVAAAQWVNGTNTTVVVDDSANTIKINATNTNDVDYINAASFDTNNGVLTLSGVGNAGATVDLDGRYLTSYSETDTLATVVSRGNATSGTLEVTGTGSWLTVEGNAANTSVPLSQGLAFGWNRSGGSNETEIIFRGSTSGHSSRLDIRSYDGSNFKTLAQFKGDEEIVFPNAGNIVAEEGGAERILQRSYDGSRWARLVSNSVGGELQLGRSNAAHVKIVTLGDSYLNGGDVGIGQTSPSYKLDVTGTIRATGDVIAYSDKRAKENIKTIDNALEKVNQLRGVEFNKIGENKKSIGVIAQEVEKILPQVISTDKKDMKSVAYGNIVGILIEAIKELSDKVKALENGSTG